MNKEQVQQTFLALLDKANKAGVYSLEESNAAIQALTGLSALSDPIPPDPSKPKQE